MWQLKKFDMDRWNVIAEHSTKMACQTEAVERGFVYKRRGEKFMRSDVIIVETEQPK